jgi:hypothetical protein
VDLSGAIASVLLAAAAALGVHRMLRRSREAQELADRKRNQLIKERLNEAPPSAPPVRRREITVQFPEHVDQ